MNDTAPAYDLLPGEAAVDERGSVVVVGNFDGVHRGHVAVLADAVELARERGLSAYVLTFDPHPSVVVRKIERPRLMSLARRSELIAEAGIDRVFVRRFDAEFAAWPPERFADELLAKTLRARVVVVGTNFRFGARRAGDLSLLSEVGAKLGFESRAHRIVGDEGGPFSSSRARAAVEQGDMPAVTRVLGRPHALDGVVVEGAKLGRTLGFPTANLGGVEVMLPPDGIYAVRVDRIEGAAPRASGASRGPRAARETARPIAGGAMSIGVRPTIGDGLSRTVETYLFDGTYDLYGARLRVHVIERLRGEEKFDGLDALKAQMAKDEGAARARLARADA